MDSVGGESSGLASAQSNLQDTTNRGAGSAASFGDGSIATTGQGSSKPSWQSIDWSQVDPQELIRSVPSLQGHIGNLTQQQAQRLARKMVDDDRARQEADAAVARTKAERDEMRRLAQEDPDRLAQMVTERVTREEYNDWQANIRREMQSEFTGYIASEVQKVYDDPEVQEVMQTADREMLARLDWRNHDGLAPWVKTVNAVIAEKRAEKKYEKLSKARSLAADKEGVVEGARDDARDGVDLGLAGSIPGGRVFTRDDLTTMSLDEYRKYKKVIAVQEREGRLR